jgi:hypothetical protein
MTIRTYKFLGKCFSVNNSAEIKFSVNNTILFNNHVNTESELTPDRIDSTDLEDLFTFELPQDVSGKISVKIEVSGGDCVFGVFLANYSGYKVKWVNQDTPPTIMIPPEYSYNRLSYDDPHEDNKTNVYLDGVNVTASVNVEDPDNANNTTGWHYLIPADSVLELEYYIDPSWKVLSIPDAPPNNIYGVIESNNRGKISVIEY